TTALTFTSSFSPTFLNEFTLATGATLGNDRIPTRYCPESNAEAAVQITQSAARPDSRIRSCFQERSWIRKRYRTYRFRGSLQSRHRSTRALPATLSVPWAIT